MAKEFNEVEIWRNVKGCNGRYQVSSMGRFKKITNDKEELLKGARAATGLKFFVRDENGHKMHRLIHQMMAEVFLDNLHGYSLVRHKDGDKFNNALSNLEWWGGIQKKDEDSDFDYNSSFSEKELAGEIWKPVPGASGYEVSSIGRIATLNWHKTGRRKLMRPHKNRKGYLCVTIKMDSTGVRRNYGIHRLVALTFIPNPDPEHNDMIDHIDENKINNRVENLQWIDNSTNSTRGTAIKRMTETIKPITDSFKKPVLMYSAEGKFLREFECMGDVNDYLGISRYDAGVSMVCRGISKTSRGYIYRYKIGDVIPTSPGPVKPVGRNRKAVAQIDIETGRIIKTYVSAREAVKALEKPLHSRQISDCCKGRGKSAYGYFWKYIDEIDDISLLADTGRAVS